MDQETFAAVDAFVEETIVPPDEQLRAALDAAEAAGLPAIQVSPPQGRLLQILARLQGARTVLEFGTLGGYSTILLARAVADGGRVISLEANAEYAEVARASIAGAGLGEVVEIRVGPELHAARLHVGAAHVDLVSIQRAARLAGHEVGALDAQAGPAGQGHLHVAVAAREGRG